MDRLKKLDVNMEWMTPRNVSVVFLSLVTVKASHSIYKYYRAKSKVKAKREECLAACEKLAEHLNKKGITQEKKDAITRLSITELIEKLQSGELKAVDVYECYQAAALEVNRRLNCVVEPIWEAEEMAIERDQRSGTKGPLHGVPVSIKENYYIKGYDCTAGMQKCIGEPVSEDAVIVKVLKKQGAVPFVRTNVPQTMMTFECSNPIYGRTLNPHDEDRGPGGSSGGEGALIAAGGSILGIGTDIGGSIRIPANMCGICGLKPTVGRLSSNGTHKLTKGQTLVRSAAGVLARDVDGVVIAMRALLCQYMFDLDPTVPPIQFREEIYSDKAPLRIGFYLDDGYIPSVPSMHRAVEKAKVILETQGHKMIQMQPLDARRMFKLFLDTVGADGTKTYRVCMEDDIYDSTVRQFFFTSTLPGAVKKVIGWVMAAIARDDMPGYMIKALSGIGSVYDYWNHALDIEEYKDETLALWRSQGIDAVICPGFAFPAIPHNSFGDLVGGTSYSSMYNLLNYPAGVVPVTKVTEQDVKDMANYPQKTMFEKNIKKMMLGGTVGLSCGVQCVALPYREELVLRLMKEIEEGLKGDN
ncbi:vitamin D3 hydroxylase-associated protein-like [Saccostrea echinata]|uniref:vitamin D3 hydroxylase-associated protein-like n=1 Tax=Saccostrea echinata TaxID=191078 RepID=UPI002A81916B|nr:vitamin D3 hydroxylase-associated protein-like [Saccostrea echinata]